MELPEEGRSELVGGNLLGSLLSPSRLRLLL